MTHKESTMQDIRYYRGKVPGVGSFILRRDVNDPVLLAALNHGMHGRSVQRGVYASFADEKISYLEQGRAALLSVNQPDAVIDYVLVALINDVQVPGEKMTMPACVNVPRNKRRPSRKGIHFHTSDQVPVEDVVMMGPDKDVAVFSMERALVNMARDRSWSQFQVAVVAEDALGKGKVTKESIIACIARLEHMPGIFRAIKILGACFGLTQSPAETKAAIALARGHVQTPEMQHRVEISRKLRERVEAKPLHPAGKPLPPAVFADFAWPEYKLIVEVDGRAFHSDEVDQDYDHRRQWALERLGWRVLRFTGAEVFGNPKKFVAKVQRALNQQVYRSDRN
jgi:hypothetical protein